MNQQVNQVEKYINRCLQLSEKGFGSVAPNPMVGAVIVHDNKVIGEGYHEKYGHEHAEVKAINSIPEGSKHLLKESELYVNLEPCCYQGKTPPCTTSIIEHNIPTIYISIADPNPLVSGQGIALLKEKGCKVTVGVLQPEAEELNKRFITFQTKSRPYIILKWAMTSNGFISEGDNIQSRITNDQSVELVHKWRSEEQAILVGKNTAIIDDPQLTVRHWKGKNPVRIVFDRNLELPSSLHLFDQEAPTLVFNAKRSEVNGDIELIKISFDEDNLDQLLSELFNRNIQSVIIEGGRKVLENFIKKGFWDEARIFISKDRFNKGVKAPEISGIQINKREIGRDHLLILKQDATSLQE